MPHAIVTLRGLYGLPSRTRSSSDWWTPPGCPSSVNTGRTLPLLSGCAMRDLYSILDVGRNSSNAAIKAAYRGLAKQSHPDLHLGDGEAENRTKEINYAYTILGDPVLRAAYDEELDMLSAKERKVAFMNASAIAAGIALFAIAAGALAFAVTRMRNSDRHRRARRRGGRARVASQQSACRRALLRILLWR